MKNDGEGEQSVAPTTMTRVSPTEVFKQILRGDALFILDVRNEEEYADWRIEGPSVTSINLIYEPLVRFGVTESIPVVPWAPRGSEESVSGIVQIVREHPGLPAVLLANHGVLAFSSSPMQTARLLATLDEAAELILGAQALGGAKTLPKQAYAQVEARMRAFGSTM